MENNQMIQDIMECLQIMGDDRLTILRLQKQVQTLTQQADILTTRNQELEGLLAEKAEKKADK